MHCINNQWEYTVHVFIILDQSDRILLRCPLYLGEYNSIYTIRCYFLDVICCKTGQTTDDLCTSPKLQLYQTSLQSNINVAHRASSIVTLCCQGRVWFALLVGYWKTYQITDTGWIGIISNFQTISVCEEGVRNLWTVASQHNNGYLERC